MEMSQAERKYGAVNFLPADLEEVVKLSNKIEKKDGVKLSNRATIMKAIRELAKKY